MKIVCISDTHGHHKKFDIPDGDVLVFAGDMMTAGRDHFEIISFNKWLGRLPHSHKIVIAGNHDRLFESNPSYAQGLLTNCTYLENSGCEIDGVKFWGSPYTPAFYNWAFNSTPEEFQKHWNLIPSDTDVLITHGPAFGILDTITAGTDHLGCIELAKTISRIVPRLHVFGHIHGGHGWMGKAFTGDCKCVNASLVDEGYRPVNEPIVVEL